jgi:hypothetical protein
VVWVSTEVSTGNLERLKGRSAGVHSTKQARMGIDALKLSEMGESCYWVEMGSHQDIKYWVVVALSYRTSRCAVSVVHCKGSSGKQTTVLLELSILNARVSGDLLTAFRKMGEDDAIDVQPTQQYIG